MIRCDGYVCDFRESQHWSSIEQYTYTATRRICVKTTTIYLETIVIENVIVQDSRDGALRRVRTGKAYEALKPIEAGAKLSGTHNTTFHSTTHKPLSVTSLSTYDKLFQECLYTPSAAVLVATKVLAVLIRRDAYQLDSHQFVNACIACAASRCL